MSQTRISKCQACDRDIGSNEAIYASGKLLVCRECDAELNAAKGGKCANCEGKIGKLETPRKFNGESVCVACFNRLSGAPGVAAANADEPKETGCVGAMGVGMIFVGAVLLGAFMLGWGGLAPAIGCLLVGACLYMIRKEFSLSIWGGLAILALIVLSVVVWLLMRL